MQIKLILLCLISVAGGFGISAGYFAFISMIGIFTKLAQKIKGGRHILLVEGCLTYGAVISNIIYVFKIKIPMGIPVYSLVNFFGGVFIGCLAGALAEVLNVFPIMSRRLSFRRGMPYVIIAVALGKFVGTFIFLMAYGV